MQDVENPLICGQYIRRITFHFMRIQDDLLAPYDITSQQARTLGVIQLHIRQKGSCLQKDLERSFGLRSSSVTSLLKNLEKKEFIHRVSGAEDARTKQLSLTKKGKKWLGVCLKIIGQTEEKMMDGMSEEEKALFLKLLKRAADNLE